MKTSTGFGSGGATIDDVKLMRKTVGPDMGVKAAGGIRDRKSALEMIDSGADRIGTSAGVKLVKSQPARGTSLEAEEIGAVKISKRKHNA